MKFADGDPVVWFHVPRGGYGYGCWVLARVVRVRRRVLVRVVNIRTGNEAERWVERGSLLKPSETERRMIDAALPTRG